MSGACLIMSSSICSTGTIQTGTVQAFSVLCLASKFHPCCRGFFSGEFCLRMYVHLMMVSFVLCQLRLRKTPAPVNPQNSFPLSKILNSWLFEAESTPCMEDEVLTVFTVGIQHAYLQLDFLGPVSWLVLSDCTSPYFLMHSNKTSLLFTPAYPVLEVCFKCLKAQPSEPTSVLKHELTTSTRKFLDNLPTGMKIWVQTQPHCHIQEHDRIVN